MAHCKYSEIEDLEKALSFARNLEKIKEKKPGIFYLKSRGFLHFHSKDGRRWADIRKGNSWGPEVNIPFKPSQKEINHLIKEIKVCYEQTIN